MTPFVWRSETGKTKLWFENSKTSLCYRTLEGTQEPSRVLAMNGLSHEPGGGFIAVNSGDFCVLCAMNRTSITKWAAGVGTGSSAAQR